MAGGVGETTAGVAEGCTVDVPRSVGDARAVVAEGCAVAVFVVTVAGGVGDARAGFDCVVAVTVGGVLPVPALFMSGVCSGMTTSFDPKKRT